MTRRRAALAVVVGLAASLLLVAPARSAVPGVVEITPAPGFGSASNSYSWAMTWFHGKLYVGTARNQLCVEAATLDFYLGDVYREHPDGFPEVTCPPDRYDLDLRAEIWEYTPETGVWRLAYQAPADVPNPAAPGKFVARDIGYRGMVVHTEPDGTEALYVAGVTADEYIPALVDTHPPRVLRTTDGVTFTAVPGAPATIVTDAWGVQRPIGYRSMASFQGRLLVSAYAGLTGDGALFEIIDPTGPEPQWAQVTPPEILVFEVATFDDHLYIGAGDAVTGYSVWKTDAVGAPSTFTPVITGGAGRGESITSVVSMAEFRGRLYVGASGWAFAFPSSELVRIAPDDTWEVVVGNPRFTADGAFRFPISGLPDGYGNLFNGHFWRMQEYQGALYLGTNDWSWAFRNWPIIGDLLRPGFGFDVYGSCDGQYWWPVTVDAFGDGAFNFGLRTMAASGATGYLGSTNHVEGTAVWRTDVPGFCGAPPPGNSGNPGTPGSPGAGAFRARAAAMTERLLAVPQPCGTVLAWDPEPRASRYRVVRTEQRPVGTVPVPAAPAARTAAVPDPALRFMVPGGPTVEADATVTSPPATLGVTTDAVFVDRTAVPGATYTYQVVAEQPDGRVANQSALAAVPSARPQASFEQVAAAISAEARQQRGPALERLLHDARAAWDRSDTAGRVQSLAALEHKLLVLRHANIVDPMAADGIGDLVHRLRVQLQHEGRSCAEG